MLLEINTYKQSYDSWGESYPDINSDKYLAIVNTDYIVSILPCFDCEGVFRITLNSRLELFTDIDGKDKLSGKLTKEQVQAIAESWDRKLKTLMDLN